MDYENPIVQMYRGILDRIGIKKYARKNGSLLTMSEADKLEADELHREFFDKPPASLEDEVKR